MKCVPDKSDSEDGDDDEGEDAEDGGNHCPSSGPGLGAWGHSRLRQRHIFLTSAVSLLSGMEIIFLLFLLIRSSTSIQQFPPVAAQTLALSSLTLIRILNHWIGSFAANKRQQLRPLANEEAANIQRRVIFTWFPLAFVCAQPVQRKV